MKIFTRALLTCSLSLAASGVWASSATLNFNYIATNLHGSAGVSNVATATITDLVDLGLNGEGYGGVRIVITANNLSQFASGAPDTSVWISAFELNFPGTSTDNGYNFNNQFWSHVSGVQLAPVTSNGLSGGIEWQEDGQTNGWGAVVNDPAFGQEYNFVSTGLREGQTSVIDIYNSSASFSGISVANLLDPANYVVNATNPEQPDALGWIKIRGTGNADPSLRGVASNGFWGASVTGGNPVQNRVNVLAVAQVPVPAALPLFFSAMTGLGLMRLNRRSIK